MGNKYKIINSNIIESVFNEEIKPYENDLSSCENLKNTLSKITIENYFNQLEREKKEKMISISNVYDDTLDGETINLDSDSEIIKYIINSLF